MNSLDLGRLVISKSGHDKGKVYVIFDYDDEYVYLTDGNLKPIDRLKKKSIKHIQMTKRIAFELIDKCSSDKLVNEDIKRAIKLYMKETNN